MMDKQAEKCHQENKLNAQDKFHHQHRFLNVDGLLKNRHKQNQGINSVSGEFSEEKTAMERGMEFL